MEQSITKGSRRSRNLKAGAYTQSLGRSAAYWLLSLLSLDGPGPAAQDCQHAVGGNQENALQKDLPAGNLIESSFLKGGSGLFSIEVPLPR